MPTVGLVVAALLSAQAFQMTLITERSTGLVLSASQASMPDTTSTTSVLSPVLIGTPDGQPVSDDTGRCRWVCVEGSPVLLAQPRWPASSAFKEARRASILRRFDEQVDRTLFLQQWQNTPALRNMRDRSDELQTAQDRITALRAIYTGP